MKEKPLKMPFGKYKGEELYHIADEDPKYILWLTTLELDGNLKKVVDELADEIGTDAYDLDEDAYNFWNKD